MRYYNSRAIEVPIPAIDLVRVMQDIAIVRDKSQSFPAINGKDLQSTRLDINQSPLRLKYHRTYPGKSLSKYLTVSSLISDTKHRILPLQET